MNALRFRPQDLAKKFTVKQRLLPMAPANWHWQTRSAWYPAGWKANQIGISRRFGRLHYLACHAPAPVQAKWQGPYQWFVRRHLGDHRRASMRYLNTWSCHSWL